MFGLYVHIPFCLQRCRYCDFATYSTDQIAVNSAYVDGLITEISRRKNIFNQRELSTVYFGGGTPSLLDPKDFRRLFSALRDNGFSMSKDCEITLEINPATLNQEKLEELLDCGFNRMSVGVQTFSDEHLKNCGRKHNADDSWNTLELLKKSKVNFSMDLLFALPNQTLKELEYDLGMFQKMNPHHISPYCLTLAEKHPMNINRPDDENQREMFKLIWQQLEEAGYEGYEISNFAKPGFASRHNLLYWQDQSYWGIGLSAHSYRPYPDWGARFWNPSDYHTYLKQMDSLENASPDIAKNYGHKQCEVLEIHQSLTDFCYTAMRLMSGLNENSVRQKYGDEICNLLSTRLGTLEGQGLVVKGPEAWRLSREGILISNHVFSELLFTPEDIDKLGQLPIIKALKPRVERTY